MSAGTRRRSWSARYPPLLAVAVALSLAVFALPSALNLPQANPSQTLEYAPVPGDSGNTSGGNFAGLGLGGGGAAGGSIGPTGGNTDSTSADAPLQPLLNGSGGVPSTKQCVGNPPHQTEDPLAPPCVAFYSGNNGGATYRGVTATEVRLVFYFDCCVNWAGTSQGSETMPTNKYFDLGKAGQPNDPVFVRMLRIYQKYFNDRYQTYKRTLHFWAYFGSPSTSSSGTVTPEARRADAEENFRTIQPYAVENFATSNSQAYVEAMAAHGVPSFGFSALGPGVFAGHPTSYFSKHPRMIWDYLPSLERQSQIVSSWICKKLVPLPASFAGDSSFNGKPRTFALLHTTDPGFPEIQQYAALIKQQVSGCGGKFVADGTFPNACCGVSSDYQNSVQNEADFKRKGATTVIWAGGLENTDPQAATSVAYRPEWILAGDRGLDSFGNAQLDDQTQWQHAWTVSTVVKVGANSGEPCYQALASEDAAAPGAGTTDVSLACTMYDELRELVIGIQIAGPHLNPDSMDQGFRAIPHISSSDPRVPACFYEPGDYTCVKDGTAMYWDVTGQPPNGNQKGCWRMAEGGKRHLPGQWPDGEPDLQKAASDPCNGF